MRKIALILCSIVLLYGQLLAQTRTIAGKVLDEKGNPIPLVSVFAKGTRNGVTTATDGSFQLHVGPNTKKLVISSIGYIGQEINLGGSAGLTVVLKLNLGEIGEVVVTGYSRIKKSEYSGAATIVGKELIDDVPMATFDQILQGRVPGLLVTTGSGQPGESNATKVQIRGQGSISGGNDPLYIVDGMPVEAENFAGLNAADFENVEVLKDAVATAQYGNRGSSGVIVVTTKRGRAGKSVVTYSGQAGITQPGTQKFDMANSAQILQIQENIGLQVPGIGLPGWLYSPKNPANIGAGPVVGQENAAILDSLRHINTDWKKVFQRQGTFQRHDLSLSGGTENTKFFLTGGYYKEQGIALKSDLTRYSFRANIDTRANRLSVSLSSGVSYSTANFIQSENSVSLANSFAAVYLALPYQKLFNPDGSIATGAGNTGANAYEAQVEGSAQSSGRIKADFSLNANYDITKNFYVGGFLGADYRQTTSITTVTPGSFFANTAGFPIGPAAGDSVGHGSYSPVVNSYFENVVRAFGGFRKVFNEKHDVDIQLVSEYTRDHQLTFGYTGFGIDPNLQLTPAGVTQGDPNNLLIAQTGGGSKIQRALYAAMFLGKYTYEGKYTLNATIRRDGTSQLGVDKRFQNFYSGGITWNALKEDFAQSWTWVDDLRFRLSYGQAANADGFFFGYFGYLPQYGAGNYAGNPTTAPTVAGNLDVTWERIKTWNAGFDFGLLKQRVSGSFDIYRKTTYGNIIDQQLSYTSGFPDQPINAGIVVNKGVELALNADVIRYKDFRWTVGGNISYNNNKVTSLGQVKQFVQGTTLVKVGLPLGSQYLPKWAGVDAATGQALYYDSSGKVTNAYDQGTQSVANFGTFNAPWIGGFSTGFHYKGFSLEAFFTFQQGFSISNNQDFFQTNPAFVLQGYNVRTNVLTMWQKPGDVTDIQSPTTTREFSSKDIQDASYVRFRNLTLSYNFDRKLLNKTKAFSAARIFVQAENLYTWTNWIGFDPEYANNIATYGYPVPRTYTVGLTTSF
jgi:TonB-linked SusC/RagA family outer membrane protein